VLMLNQIIHGDCKKIFPQIRNKYSKILLIFDPPYNIGFKRYEDHGNIKYKDNLSDEEYIDLLKNFRDIPAAVIQYPEEMMKYVVPAMGQPEKVLAWCYPSNIGRKFRLINIYKRKPNFSKIRQPYKNPTDKRVAKRIEAGYNGAPLYDWFSDINLVKNVSEEKTIHPCQISTKLIKRLILLLSEDKDEIIVDPFVGSGTTAIASIMTDRNYVGIEISKKY